MLRRSTSLIALCAILAATIARAAEEHFFDSDGVKIRYVEAGEGEPVILVHGFTASAMVQWQLPGIFTKLAQDYRVIAIDNRGHGKSDKPHDPAEYGPKMVQDVVNLMDHLMIDKAHIVGYSMGGFMTGYMIANHPDRIISATMGGAGWSQADDPRLAFIDDLAKSLDEGKGIGPLIIQLNPANRPKPTEEQIAMVNKMLTSTNDQKALAACIRGMLKLEVPEEKLKANQVPVLAIIGDLDPLKAGVDEMQSRMSNLKVCVIDGADHMTCFTNRKFVEDLKAFLAEHAAEPATVSAGAN